MPPAGWDKAFLINLDRRPDRLEQALEEIEEHELGEVERFPGVDHWYGGNDGCTKSHRLLLRKVVVGSWDRVLVLEDDLQVLTDDVLSKAGFGPSSQVMRTFRSAKGNTLREKLAFLLPQVPLDWNIVYLGGGYKEKPLERIGPHVLRCAGMAGTHAYLITKEFAAEWTRRVDEYCALPGMAPRHEELTGDERLLDTYPGPIDNQFCWLGPEYRMYVLQPRLIVQRESKSDITGLVVPGGYLCSMCDSYHEGLL